MNEVEIPLKITGIGSMKAELRALKAEIANATDPEQMAALAQQAGVLSDKIKDANDAVNVFASGSKFEQVSNGLGGIKNSLMSLDFEEANDKAKVFAKNLGSLNQKDISASLKGLTGTVSTMGGAFVKLGMQILANPLFLLVAVITAIVVAIGAFLNKIGVLGKVLDTIMAPINAIIDGFKWLTDTLGLTSFAAEENAEKISKANESIIESSKKRSESLGASYDFEIEKAKISGKNTTKLELEKSKTLSNEAKVRRDRQIKELKALNAVASEDNKEQRKKLKESINAENTLIRQGARDRILIQMRETQAKKEEYRKQREAAQKAAEDEAKAAADAAADAAREAAARYRERQAEKKKATEDIQKEIAAANKLIVDSGKTQQQKETDDVKAKYAELIKQAEKYKQDTTALKQAEQLEIDAINKTFEEQEQEKKDKQEAEDKANDKRKADQLQAFNDLEAQKSEELAELIYQSGLTAQQKELEANKYKYDELIAQAERYGQDTKLLKEQQADEQAKINAKYALQEIEQEKAKRDAKIQLANDVATGLGAIGEMFIKDQKKLEKFNKAQALVQIGIDTAKAISSLIATSQANPFNAVTGGAAGIAQYASGIVQIITNVAKAKALLSNPNGSVSGGGGGGGGTESSTSVSQATPSIQMFGQGNNLNTTGGTKSVNANQNMVVTAVVSESDITSTQNKLSKLQKSAEL
jgi:hypothetical protein